MHGRSGPFPVGDRVRLWHVAVGDGPDPLIVPGAALKAADVERLVAGRTVVFYDRRGRSDPVDERVPVGTDEEVADLEAVRAHVGLAHASVFGSSYPGAVAALYAARHPERVDRLPMVCPLPPCRSPAPELRAEAEAARRAQARIDAAGLARLEELRAAGLPERDPAAFCREHRRVHLPRRLADAASRGGAPLGHRHPGRPAPAARTRRPLSMGRAPGAVLPGRGDVPARRLARRRRARWVGRRRSWT